MNTNMKTRNRCSILLVFNTFQYRSLICIRIYYDHTSVHSSFMNETRSILSIHEFYVVDVTKVYVKFFVEKIINHLGFLKATEVTLLTVHFFLEGVPVLQ